MPDDGISVIYGSNGSGKTSLLEGIHYCALTKGFAGSLDSECVMFSSDYFLLNSTFIADSGRSSAIKVTYTRGQEKQIIVDHNEIKPFSRHIGHIPCITFSPAEIVIVNGSPSERRRFLDSAISQTDRTYLDNLLAYRRVLEQRNAFLAQCSYNRISDKQMLYVWTEQLARLAAYIVSARIRFVDAFFDRFRELFSQLSVVEEPRITYRCSLGTIIHDCSCDYLFNLFLDKYSETEKTEIFRAQTLTGPHRDDLLFFLNDREIKKYASQGQLRTFLITLKLAQYCFFLDTLHEKPVCLLDDIFSELDASRVADIFMLLQTCGQSIITSVESRGIGSSAAFFIDDLKNSSGR